MSVARHKRDPDVEDLSLEEIMQRYVGRFAEKKAASGLECLRSPDTLKPKTAAVRLRLQSGSSVLASRWRESSLVAA